MGHLRRRRQAVIIPDSICRVEWSGDYRIINYAIEEGNFETYNKVQQPFEPTVIMRKGGSPATGKPSSTP